jgi:hypothetical protein
MSPNSERNPAEFFTVFGAAYIPEHRDEHCDDGHARSFDDAASERRGRSFYQPELGVASLWLMFYAAVIAISLVASSSAGKWVEIAALAVK